MLLFELCFFELWLFELLELGLFGLFELSGLLEFCAFGLWLFEFWLFELFELCLFELFELFGSFGLFVWVVVVRVMVV